MKPNIIQADLDDIVFANRERGYGAFPLRKSYERRLMGATAGILGFVLSLGFVLHWNLIFPEKENRFLISCMGGPFEIDTVAEPERHLSIYLSDIHQIGNIPPKPKKEIYSIPEPVKGLKVEEGGDVKKNIRLPKINVSDLIIGECNEFEENPEAITNSNDCACPPIENPQEAIEWEEKMIREGWLISYEEPKLINIMQIRKLIGYPEIAKDAGITGQVVIRVLIDECGNYKKHKVIKKIHPILAQACEKHIHKLKFTPVIRYGKCVSVWVNIPFKFHAIN